MIEKQLNNIKVRCRKGIAMIELIFAIVIIGITLMSIPNLVYQASESGYTTIQQESIAAAASDLSLILSREWDESGTDPSIGSPILGTASGTIGLEYNRTGVRSRSYATGLGGTLRIASSIFNDGDFDDIDDANGTTGKLTLIESGDEDDLIDINITISTDVNYTIDAPATGNWNSSSVALTYNFPPTGTPPTVTTNIKHVNITLTTENLDVEELSDKKIIFNAFSCNIGSYKLERRVLKP